MTTTRCAGSAEATRCTGSAEARWPGTRRFGDGSFRRWNERVVIGYLDERLCCVVDAYAGYASRVVFLLSLSLRCLSPVLVLAPDQESCPCVVFPVLVLAPGQRSRPA